MLRRSDCNLENKRQKLLKLLSRPRARVIHVYPSDRLLGRDTCKKVKGTVFLFYVGSSKKTSAITYKPESDVVLICVIVTGPFR